MNRSKFTAFMFFILMLVFVTTAHAKQTASFALIGDAGLWNKRTALVEKSVRDMGVFNLILPGDNLYHGTYEDAWNPWIQNGFHFQVVAIGNHTAGYQKEIKFFRMPSEAYTTWLAPGIAVIVLNSDNINSARQQAVFLEQELRTLSADSLFVVYHHPSLTLSADHPWEERENFHDVIRPLLYKYRDRISAVINGHDHMSAAFSFNDLPVIISGAIKEFHPVELPSKRQQGTQVKMEWAFPNRATWARLKVHPHSSHSEIDFVLAESNLVLCTIQIKTGEWLFLEKNCNSLRQKPQKKF